MWLRLAIITMILFLLAAPQAHAWELNPVEKIDDAIGKLVNALISGVKGLFDAVFGAMGDFVRGIGEGLKKLATSFINVMVRPFELLYDSIKNANAWFEQRLGPLAPLGLAAVIGGVIMIIWRVIAKIVPGPIP